MPTTFDKHPITEFSKLNEKQLRAVELTEGPVLVLAGPGTGKTEVLALRIANILLKNLGQAENILCLTYSNAGVNAMRNRLKELIGVDAEKVTIQTYHGFSNGLLNTYAANKLKGKRLVTDTMRTMLIETLITRHLAPHDPADLKPASSQRVSNLQKIFSFLKQEGVTREEMNNYVDDSLNNILPFEDGYLLQAGGLNADGRKLRDKIINFSERIFPMYEDYCAELEARQLIEFEDMLNEAILLLQSNDDLLKSQQEKYQYILVDEFQDTNKKQIALLELLASSIMEPNLFAVGDDDQCIYRFQGASAFNFQWMRNKFKDRLQVIYLDTNYRSTSVLLQEAFGLISVNSNRQPEKDQPLIAGNLEYAKITPEAPIFRSYHDAEQEACGIAQSIVEQLNAGKHAEQIAVLTRRWYDLDMIKKWLSRYNIPWQLNQTSYNLMDGHYGSSLFHLLMFVKIQSISAYDAAGFFVQFMLKKKDNAAFLKAYLQSRETKNYDLYNWLKNNQHDISYFKELTDIVDQLLMLRNQQITSDTISLLTKAVYLGTDYTLDEQEQKVWIEFVDSFLVTYDQKSLISLADLLWYQDQYMISIKVDRGESGLDDDAVILSTIHGSKGLQYDSVYLIASHDKNWENKSKRGQISVPDILNRFISPEADSLDDLRRLIYVACTRAKTRLYVSLHRNTPSDYPQNRSVLLDNFGLPNGVVLEEIADYPLPEMQEDAYTVDADKELVRLIKSKVESFELSPSSVNTWEQCQNEFFFTQVLKLGGITSEAPSFGTIVHDVLQAYAEDDNRLNDPDIINRLVDFEIDRKKHLFHPTHVEKYRRYGKWLLSNYLARQPIRIRPAYIEEEFKTTLDNGVKIKGKLDRVEEVGGNFKVIDYKTGRQSETAKPFESKAKPGTKYWRQAMMYSMLVNDTFEDARNVEFEFHYPEIEKIIFPFKAEENVPFVNWLGEIWANTMELKFNRACEKPGCNYCKLDLIG
jgi:DNA helicase-2/ATP-dependent DNA helicase PcrA